MADATNQANVAK
jgi:hypothetical protein